MYRLPPNANRIGRAVRDIDRDVAPRSRSARPQYGRLTFQTTSFDIAASAGSARSIHHATMTATAAAVMTSAVTRPSPFNHLPLT